MKKIVFIGFLLCLHEFAFGINEALAAQQFIQTSQVPQQQPEPTPQKPPTQEEPKAPAVFGAHLFNGNFTQASQFLFNPDYRIAIGDKINLRIWGAVEIQKELMVDSQGNVFIPSVGAVNLLGVRNGDLQKTIQRALGRVYKSNVFSYADMNVYQNVSVFVTGNVNKPGLYQGLSSDSIVQYLDKASGINLDYGSFRDIEILRDNKVVMGVDLYEFLLSGKLSLFPFRNGDVVLVKDLKSYVFVQGEVQKPYRFELKDQLSTLEDIYKTAGAKPAVTNAIVRSFGQNNIMDIRSYNRADFAKVMLQAGDEIEFRPDYFAQNVTIKVEGEHNGATSMVLKKGTTLAQVVRMLRPNNQSDLFAIQVFRKSIAKSQKDLIDAQLKELETIALTASSVSPQDAAIRANQSKLILEFIERVKNVQPKGQVIVDGQNAYEKTILEEGDVLFIPTKNNLVIVQGEVALPGAFVYMQNQGLNYYIKLAGDFTERANKSRVIVIRANGKAEKYNDGWLALGSSPSMRPGDSILVLPKIDTGQNLQITSLLSQILYQIAIATNVVLNLNK